MARVVLAVMTVMLTAVFAYAEDTNEAKLFHNDGYFIGQEFIAGHTEFKRTVTEMNELRGTHHIDECGESARLLTELDRRFASYHDLVQKFVVYYKKKWNQKHYQTMDDAWKKDAFNKHKAKIKALHDLMRSLGDAYNAWNDSRTAAVKKKTAKDIGAIIGKGNDVLQKALREGQVKEKEAFEAMGSELNTVKNLKL